MNVLRIAAFSDGHTGGNPAGVMLADEFPGDPEMQQIAAAVGFSETAFAVPVGSGWRARNSKPILRNSAGYRAQRVVLTKTRPTKAATIGVRKAPTPEGRPGFIRIDSVHRGDQDGIKGLYHINAVDCVTQREVVATVSGQLPVAADCWWPRPLVRNRVGKPTFDARAWTAKDSSPLPSRGHARGQFLPLATGSYPASHLAMFASEATGRQSPEGAHTEVGTHRLLRAIATLHAA